MKVSKSNYRWHIVIICSLSIINLPALVANEASPQSSKINKKRYGATTRSVSLFGIDLFGDAKSKS